MSKNTSTLEGRYQRPSNSVSPLTKVLIGLALAAFLAFGIYANFLGRPLASVELTSFQKVDATTISGTFTALTGSQPADCAFKAFTTNGAIVGYLEVEIPANNDDAKPQNVVVKTTYEASVLKADGCRVK
jgi:hypothetical protein